MWASSCICICSIPKQIMSNPDLFLLLKSKDEKAFSSVYDLYAASLYGILLKNVGDESLAAEMLTRTFINIWKECPDVDCAKQKLFTWVISLTYKTALNDFKINLYQKKSPVKVAASS